MANNPQELLFKYFSGNCTAEELQSIQDWISQSPENLIEFQKLEKTWFSRPSNNIDPNVDRAWEKINSATSQPQLVVSHRSTTNTIKWLSGIAASLALFTFAWFYLFNSPQWETIKAANNETAVYDFPDGSKVWLKESGKLSFSFDESERLVKLSGEAFFEVAKESDRPFSIALKETEITVLGTSFYAASSLNGTDQVSVSTGTVSFADIDNSDKKVVLEAGDEAILQYTTNNLVKRKSDNPNLLSWQNGVFVFNKTPLTEVITLLADYYNVSISLENDAMGNCLITSRFENQSCDEVLDVIKKLISAELIRTESSYLLKGQGC